MPLPTKNKGENKKDFLNRCMGDNVMVEEYPDQDQRYQVCLSQWDKGKTDPYGPKSMGRAGEK